MRYFFLVCLFVWSACGVSAQTTRTISALEKQRKELQEQIAASETLLRSTKKDLQSQLADLNLLNGQMDKQKKLISMIEKDVAKLDREINSLQRQLRTLEKDLAEKKKKYDTSVQYMYKNKTIQEKLMFIFSAENLSQTYRRLRYVQEYGNYQRLKGREIEQKQEQITNKKQDLEVTRTTKQQLLKENEEAKKKLQVQEKERKQLLASLQKKQRGIQDEIAKKKKSARQLNAKIDRLIEIEIEKARKLAQEEARKKAASNKSSGKETKKESEKVTSAETFRLNNSDRKLSSSFERNKGILPMPITGPYVIVGHYGKYSVGGLQNVRLDNKGIDIKGKSGAKARAIFDGEVSAIFQYNGLNNVLVRHGNYISVYCNLSSVAVSKGSRVQTKSVIGTVHQDASGNSILHFQLRKETDKLNPEAWLDK